MRTAPHPLDRFPKPNYSTPRRKQDDVKPCGDGTPRSKAFRKTYRFVVASCSPWCERALKAGPRDVGLFYLLRWCRCRPPSAKTLHRLQAVLETTLCCCSCLSVVGSVCSRIDPRGGSGREAERDAREEPTRAELARSQGERAVGEVGGSGGGARATAIVDRVLAACVIDAERLCSVGAMWLIRVFAAYSMQVLVVVSRFVSFSAISVARCGTPCGW